MKTIKINFFLILAFISITNITYAQRLIKLVNNTNCNFEAVQFEYSVFDPSSQSSNIYWYPDPVVGKPNSSHGSINLPDNPTLLNNWGLDSNHGYIISINRVLLWDIYLTGYINILPPDDGSVIIGSISNQCCESGQYEAYRFFPNPPSLDFELV